MPLRTELLERSFDLVAPRGDELVDRLIQRLFVLAPEVELLLRGADRRELRARLLPALVPVRSSLRNPDALLPILRALGARLAADGTKPRHYAAAGRALLGALADIAGPAWSEELETAWTEAYELIATALLTGAEAAPALASAA